MSQLVNAQIERINNILVTGVDPAARRLYLFGEVDDSMAARLIVSLSVLDAAEDAPITIFLHSYGGSIEAGLAIFDAVRMARNNTIMVGLGAVQSMAAVIMQSASERYMGPHARFMFHTGSISLEGDQDSDKMLSVAGEIRSLREKAVAILSERASIPAKKVREMMVKETYLSAEEALSYGFIDGIMISPPVQPKKTRKRKR